MVHRDSFQKRALLRKTVSLQLRQKGTMCCQLTTPILCLILVFLLKTIAESQIEQYIGKPSTFQSIPRILNPPGLPNYMFLGLAGLSVDSCEEWYMYNTSDEEFTQAIIENIPSHFCRSNGRNNPYFVKTESEVNPELFKAIEYVNSKPFNMKESDYIDVIPDGAFTIDKANSSYLKYNAQVNDITFKSYHRKNGVTKVGIGSSDFLSATDGMLFMMDMINKAFFETLGIKTVSFVQYMPVTIQELQELNKILNLLGGSLYPIALSLLLPVFMYAIVLEKEEKIYEFMKMNGMKPINYWITNFLFDFLLYISTTFLFYTIGILVLQLEFFTETNPIVTVSFLVGWGISQVSLSFFIQIFFNRARSATVWGYLISIGTVLWGITLNVAVYSTPGSMPWYLLLFPHFALTRIFYILSYNCGYWKCLSELHEISPEVSMSILFLFLVGTAILCSAVYLSEVVPQEYGVPKHLLSASSSDNELHSFKEEDASVKSERKRILDKNKPYKSPLLVKNLTKLYGEKVAVNNLCLEIESNEIFGLLGPNGAGKTSLMSMLTGLYPANSGDAWISDCSINTELEQVQLNIGFCPQFDILWPDLTVEEHLLFYARLKGISTENEQFHVQQAADQVFLTEMMQTNAGLLSGGMRRRLSVAISLVGNPSIVFLDEPTTGLDPENRRNLWEILAGFKRAVLLSTHSMEEADVLCGRIGILHHGLIRTIGTPTYLKNLYGGGMKLFVNSEQQEKVSAFVKTLDHDAHLVEMMNSTLVFRLGNCSVAKMFREIEDAKIRLGITDWGISQSTLEDVFHAVVK